MEKKYFLDIVNERVRNTPDRVTVRSANCPRGITYRQLDDYTGRIYHYLKQHGIGKEDIVLICLPRGVRVVMAMFGVLKAGAAFTVVEDTYLPERIQYIKNDTKAGLVIDISVYAEMMKYEPIEGYEKRDVHDACFAIYTSGSTGNPKGVLHEYGKLNEIIQSKMNFENKKIAIISPLNFLASVRYMFDSVVAGDELYIVPYETAKNPSAYVKFIEENGITDSFATPSFLKILPYFPKSLKRVFLSGENASNFFFEGINIINAYSSSEVAFTIAVFRIDRAYAVTPVGKSCTSNRIYILDEDGKEVPKGEKGEICIDNIYTRGYISLPEKTAEVFVNGVYHLGDIGYFNENDDLVVCGRRDDMIKINGNRIEPAEIENGIRKVLKITNCIARGFSDESRSFTVAYALKEEMSKLGLLKENGRPKITMDELRAELSQMLPCYMIPTYFEVLDSFPKNANGKLVRKDLPRPRAVFEEEAYIPPVGEEETHFCELFARILKLEKVSAAGDFYSLGGDSLRAMEFISECRYRDITISDLYKARTPQKLAVRLIEKRGMEQGDIDDRNRQALKHRQPLLREAQWTFETQLATPRGTKWNLTIFNELKDSVDINRLKSAIDRVLSAHPAFCSHIVFDDDGYLRMEYAPGYYQETEIITISEDEFQAQKDAFSESYRLVGAPLYKNRIYVTEQSSYLFLDFFHAITDGTSLNIIREQISGAYEDPSFVPEADYFFLIARDAWKRSLTEEYKKIGREYKAEADAVASRDIVCPVSFLRRDVDNYSFEGGNITRDLDISKKALKKDSLYFRYGGNTLFLYAFLKAQALYNGNDCAYTTWVHNGRGEAIAMNANGMLFHTYPMLLDLKQTPTDEGALAYIRDRVAAEIAGGYMDYWFDNSELSFILNISSFLYQNDIFADTWKGDFSKGEVKLNRVKEADAAIELMLIDNSDSDVFTVSLAYMKGLYSDASVNRFLDLYERIVGELIGTSISI